MNGYVDAGAEISACGKYRYLLWREWRGSHDPENWSWLDAIDGEGQRLGEPKPCLFIMLNPSIANAWQDDPTIRRCVAFARSWNFERLEVVNLFAYRATNPSALLDLPEFQDPIGPENLRIVTDAAQRAGRIICAWGSHGGHMNQDETVLGWCDQAETLCLGLTMSGFPRHPLYLSSKTAPIPFR